MTNALNENWLPVPGYEGFYSVSDQGRVRSENRKITSAGSGKTYMLPGKVLKPTRETSGHLRVSLSKYSKVKSVSVHSLVMLAFVGERPSDADICHSDGDPTNNRLANLRYDTRAANIIDSQRHGTFSEAEIHPCAILTNEQALEIYNTVGVAVNDLAAQYGITPAVVNQIWRGDTWKSVTGGEPVTASRGRMTYLRTKLTKSDAHFALANRANRTGRKDGRGIKPTADALGVDADVIRTLYAAVDAGKAIIYAE